MNQGFRQYSGGSQQAFQNNADPRNYRARFGNKGQAVNYQSTKTNEEDNHWQAVVGQGVKQAAKVVGDATNAVVGGAVDVGTEVHKNVEDNVATATDKFKQLLYDKFGEQNVNKAYYGSKLESDYNNFKRGYDNTASSKALKPVGDSIKSTTQAVTNACCVS